MPSDELEAKLLRPLSPIIDPRLRTPEQEESIQTKNLHDAESVDNDSPGTPPVTPAANQDNCEQLPPGLRSVHENPQEDTIIGYTKGTGTAESPIIVGSDEECV
jgi:hypothetical protein